jgi:hypothetical protein
LKGIVEPEQQPLIDLTLQHGQSLIRSADEALEARRGILAVAERDACRECVVIEQR